MQHDMIGLRCFFRGRIVSVSLDDIAGVRTAIDASAGTCKLCAARRVGMSKTHQ
jgi:hypothetical protein